MKSRTPMFPLTMLVAMLLTLSLGPPMSVQPDGRTPGLAS
jgi:hypothetical protein